MLKYGLAISLIFWLAASASAQDAKVIAGCRIQPEAECADMSFIGAGAA